MTALQLLGFNDHSFVSQLITIQNKPPKLQWIMVEVTEFDFEALCCYRGNYFTESVVVICSGMTVVVKIFDCT